MAGKNRKKQIVNNNTTNSTTNDNLSNNTDNNEASTSKPKRSSSRLKTTVLNTQGSTSTSQKRRGANLESDNNTEVDTGSHISKRRRREATRSTTANGSSGRSAGDQEVFLDTNTNNNQPINQMASSSSSGLGSKYVRRRRAGHTAAGGSHMDDSSSYQQPPQASSSNNVPMATSSSLSTKGSKNKGGTGKSKSKFPSFNFRNQQNNNSDSPSMPNSDPAYQGIVSSGSGSGVDISQFQNYLSSRSLSSVDIGEQINRKTEELRTSNGDRTQEYMVLTEINQHLLVSYEDTVSSLRVGELVTQVINIIQTCDDSLVDLKTICYNVLLHLMEAQPRSSDYLVSSVSTLLSKVLNLVDFDSLEQIINVIERISRRHGHSVLQAGAFTTLINYYDFLTAPQQLTILSMTNQCFQTIRPGSNTDFNQLLDGIDNLTSRLKQSESKCVEKVIQSLVHLVTAYRNDPAKLKRIASLSITQPPHNSTLFTNLQELLISSPPIIQDYHEILRMMSMLCANCPELAVTLIKQNITQTLLCVCCSNISALPNKGNSDNAIVPSSTSHSKPSITQNSSNNPINSRSTDEILAIISLIAELMPPLPKYDYLFIINRILYPSVSTNNTKVSHNNSEYVWCWFNNSANQWLNYTNTISNLFESKLERGEFEFTYQLSVSTTIKVNLLIMQQTNEQTGASNDILRTRSDIIDNNTQQIKDAALDKDSRTVINLQQCNQFGVESNLEVIEMIQNLFPLIIDIYNEATSINVRYKCLEALIRIIYRTTAKVLNSILNKASLSSLLATLLSSKDCTFIIAGIQIGILLQKLPDSLIVNFKKEGVLYQLEKMLNVWKNKECSYETSTQSSNTHKINVQQQQQQQQQEMFYTTPQLLQNSSIYQQMSLNDIPLPIQSTTVVNNSTIDQQIPGTSSTSYQSSSASQKFANFVKRTSCIGKSGTVSSTTSLTTTGTNPNLNTQGTSNTPQNPGPNQSDSQQLYIQQLQQQYWEAKKRKQKHTGNADQVLDMSLRNRTLCTTATSPAQLESMSSAILPPSLQLQPPSTQPSFSQTYTSSSNLPSFISSAVSTPSSVIPPQSSSSSTRKISQIMNLLNINQQQSQQYSHNYDWFHPITTATSTSSQHHIQSTDNTNIHQQQQSLPLVNKEYHCKQWIIKYGNRLDKSWKQNGRQESVQISPDLLPYLNNLEQTNSTVTMDVLYCLTHIAKDLDRYNSSISTDHSTLSIINSLYLFSELLTRGYYVSVFEMESSGVIEALLGFLTVAGPQYSIQRQFSNLKLFLDIFGKNKVVEKNDKDVDTNSFSSSPIGCLINNLLMCLHHQEQFHVRVFQMSNLSTNNSTTNNLMINELNSMGVLRGSASGSRFNLSQAITEAVMDRLRTNRRINTQDPYVNALLTSTSDFQSATPLESSYSLMNSRYGNYSSNAFSALSAGIFLHTSGRSNKYSDIHCVFAPYTLDSHPSDKEIGAQKFTPADNLGLNSHFENSFDVLSTIQSIEKIVIKEITKNRRINRKIGLLAKDLSMNDEDDDEYADSSDDDDEDLIDDDVEYALSGVTVDEDDDVDNDDFICDMASSNYAASLLGDDDLDIATGDDGEEHEHEHEHVRKKSSGTSRSGPKATSSSNSQVPTTSSGVGSSGVASANKCTSGKKVSTSSSTVVKPVKTTKPTSTSTTTSNSSGRVTRNSASTSTNKVANNKSGASSSKKQSTASIVNRIRTLGSSGGGKTSSQISTASSSNASTLTGGDGGIASTSGHAYSKKFQRYHYHNNPQAYKLTRMDLGQRTSVAIRGAQLSQSASSTYYTRSNNSITKVQIFINDSLIPSDMSLYQALRKHSPEVNQFLSNSSSQIAGKTDQQLEDSINQIIWRTAHNMQYRLVMIPSSNKPSSHNLLPKIFSSSSVSPSPTTTPSPVNDQPSTSHISARTRQHTSNIQPASHSSSSLSKRRRKNTTEIAQSPHSASILIDNLNSKLPYPILIDYPTIFEPIPVNLKQIRTPNNLNAADISSGTTPVDFISNIPNKLDGTLSLLRCLYGLCRYWHLLSFNLDGNSLVPETEFRSPKLTSKVNRQLQDIFYVLARNIPFWCIQLMHTCAFLFSLETRQNFFYLFNFNRARTLLYLQSSNNTESTNNLNTNASHNPNAADNLLETSTDIRRLRLTVNRSDRLLEEAELLLKNHSDPKTLMEISFSNEVGFGLGPTNEFYTQLSKALMRKDLMLWYNSSSTGFPGSGSDQYVEVSMHGLYPRPIGGKQKKLDSKTRNKFIFLGRLLARALLDCRKLDLPLNPVFYKWLLGHQESISTGDLTLIDPNLANQLRDLYESANQINKIEQNSDLSVADKKKQIEDLGIEDLQIVFVHPIHTELELVKDGINRVVTGSDLSNYLHLVITTTLLDGVRTQMEAVMDGFDSLLPGGRCHLARLFEPNEVEEVFCGSKYYGDSEYANGWDVKTLTEVCHCDHGYTINSGSIINLFEIMSEFTREQRRSFVQFCTGTPRLPVGGFRALRPPFKIVNKKEGNENPDNYLPSVMTCQNFLKLPDYSSKEIMRERLLYALQEGQNAFHLS